VLAHVALHCVVAVTLLASDANIIFFIVISARCRVMGEKLYTTNFNQLVLACEIDSVRLAEVCWFSEPPRSWLTIVTPSLSIYVNC